MPPEILVIRERDRFSSILIEQGFSVTNFPLIKTETIADLSELENHLARVEKFDGIFITSVKAAEIVSAKLSEARKDFGGKFYVLGKRSADLLRKSSFETFFSPQATSVEELLRLIPKEELKDKKFLFPRGDRSLRTIPDTFENFAEVLEVVVYRTIGAATDDEKFVQIKKKFEGGKINAVCFFSPSGVKCFLVKFENFSQNEIKIATIGKTTAQCVADNNLRADFVSAKPVAEDFARGLADYLREKF